LLALLAIAGALAWYYIDTEDASQATASNPSGGALPVSWSEPMDSVFDANPAAYQPATAASLTLNIPNQALSLLSDQYMPLFGFVGVAQGESYG
jgi:hypothetical protein